MHSLHPFFVLSPSSMNVLRSAVASFYGILYYCYAFDSLVVPLPMVVKGQRLLSQDLILREIHQEITATIYIIIKVGEISMVMLHAMIRKHSKVLAAMPKMILAVITCNYPAGLCACYRRSGKKRCVDNCFAALSNWWAPLFTFAINQFITKRGCNVHLG